MKILLLDIDKPNSNKYQFYLDWFKEAWINAGGGIKTKVEFPFNIRLVAAKFNIGRSTRFRSRKNTLLVIGGAYIDFTTFPYNFFYEIVPVFWDTWEKYHPLLISGLKRNKIKYAFFTQKEVADLVQLSIPGIKTYWMPEGVKTNEYKRGCNLNERKITILQFGRKLKDYHEVILKSIQAEQKYLFSKDDLERIFENFEEFVDGLSNSAISICFPRSITHPEITGGIETLTQRYWESILSRCLIVGKAPQELIELMGYNPVIDVDWNNPDGQLIEILNSLEDYQEFVDKNYEKALKICSWDIRISNVIKELNRLKFNI